MNRIGLNSMCPREAERNICPRDKVAFYIEHH